MLEFSRPPVPSLSHPADEIFDSLPPLVAPDELDLEEDVGAALTTWQVRIDRSFGGRLGLEMNQETLEIMSVDPDGLVHTWNQSNPSQAVARAGPRIWPGSQGMHRGPALDRRACRFIPPTTHHALVDLIVQDLVLVWLRASPTGALERQVLIVRR